MNPFSSKVKVTSAACFSHVGKKRKNNEDNLYFDGLTMDLENMGTGKVLTLEPKKRDFFSEKTDFFAVFDGMGGGDYGEMASFTAAQEATLFFDDPQRMDTHDVTISLKRFCNDANRKVFSRGLEMGTTQMGTTMVGCYFLDGRVWVSNVGDSRCYRLRNHVMEQLSVDHTDEEEMLAQGIVGRKPYLTQYLGVDPDEMYIEPSVGSYPLEAGDLFLLCSDGLTDMVGPETIQAILFRAADVSEAAGSLGKAALEGGGKDNITIIVCKC